MRPLRFVLPNAFSKLCDSTAIVCCLDGEGAGMLSQLVGESVGGGLEVAKMASAEVVERLCFESANAFANGSDLESGA